MNKLRVLTAAALMILATGAVQAAAAAAANLSGADALAQSRAIYAALRSYSDSGTVTIESGMAGAPSTLERHSFRTLYESPHKFLLDFKKSASAGGSRLVIWSDGGNFQSWWTETGVHEVYPRGQGATAFAVSSFPTYGAALAVPPLLFSQGGMHGSLSDFTLAKSAGIETLDGRRYYKLIGIVALAYGTGTVSGGRKATIWIDTDTLLIGQVLEDTPEGSGAGVIDRVTTRFLPQANPQVDPAQFQFVIPAH